jgi:hypothetical protein
MTYDPLKETIEKIALEAAAEYFERGTPPAETLSKYASDMPNDDYVNRMVECTNHLIQGRIYEKNADLREEFPTATVDVVKTASKTKEVSDGKVASVWYKDVAPEKAMSKSAMPMKSFDSVRNEVINEYGVPEIDSSRPMGKTASDHKASVDFYAEEMKNLTEKQSEFDKIAAVEACTEEVKAFIKHAYSSGQDLFKTAAGIAFAMDMGDREDVSAIVDAAVTDLVGEHCVKVADYNDYLTKAASVDLSKDGLVVHRGGDQLILQLRTTMGYIKNGPGSGREGIGVIENGAYGGGRGTWLPGGVDDNMPYEVKKILKPRQSRPFTVKGEVIS